jgi:hypothetical protein
MADCSWVMKHLRPVKHWDRWFESHSRHVQYISVHSVFVLSCVGSDLVTDWSLVQGVVPTVYEIKKLKEPLLVVVASTFSTSRINYILFRGRTRTIQRHYWTRSSTNPIHFLFLQSITLAPSKRYPPIYFSIFQVTSFQAVSHQNSAQV